ncbi:hypothetical protein V5799_006545 [Amblyomma americanum]|uniref:Uncharacterized protein n=1 Tax=Amblyomma americanum TaxID=6943 RepID=A0AAQ4DW34_AMBAM
MFIFTGFNRRGLIRPYPSPVQHAVCGAACLRNAFILLFDSVKATVLSFSCRWGVNQPLNSAGLAVPLRCHSWNSPAVQEHL